MKKFLFQTYEATVFAWSALRANVFRTILSLLGVTVGIFSIIGVYTMVDSLEGSIKNSLNSIGEKTIYVDKWPWQFGEGEYPWWKYFQRPEPKFTEYKALREDSKQAAAIAIMDWSSTTVRYKSSSFDGLCQGITYDFNQITDIPIEQGRYFTQAEMDAGRNVAIIGGTIAQTLFQEENPIGKTIKLKGQNFTVIAIQEIKGKDLVQIGGNPDEKIYIPFLKHKRLFSSGNLEGTIVMQAYESDKDMIELESETRGLMRTIRGLRPSQDDNFALNRPDAAANAISGLFGTIRTGGFFIGLFALLIGGFGIANIMFVSVKERTNIIGIQKSLGARSYVILFQFLFESIFLCLFGGFIGILLVYLASFIDLGSLDIVLSSSNIIFGIIIASIIGIVSGIVPALQAAKMDPVIAIRAK
ncbi:MAG: ABC transporter permease [Spirosomataceae bacterium]